MFNETAAHGFGHIAVAILFPQCVKFVSFYLKDGEINPFNGAGVFQGIYDGDKGTSNSPTEWNSHDAFAYWARYSDNGASSFRGSPMFYVYGNSWGMWAKAHQLETTPQTYRLIGNSCLSVASEVLAAGGVNMSRYRLAKTPIPDDVLARMSSLARHGDPSLFIWNMWDYHNRYLTRTMPPQWSSWNI